MQVAGRRTTLIIRDTAAQDNTMTTDTHPPAVWQISEWLNTPSPITLESLRGRVVVVLAFQMLCPGCVATALPLAARVHRLFPQQSVAMLGLHTVFEHHAAMTPVSLQAFLHEYRIAFPVGVDRPATKGPIPDTMRAYAMRGTPTWLIYDTEGRLRQHLFGEVDALALGAEIMRWIDAQPSAESAATTATNTAVGACDDGACVPSKP